MTFLLTRNSYDDVEDDFELKNFSLVMEDIKYKVNINEISNGDNHSSSVQVNSTKER